MCVCGHPCVVLLNVWSVLLWTWQSLKLSILTVIVAAQDPCLTCSRVLVCEHLCQCLWLQLITLVMGVRPVAAQEWIWGHYCVSLAERPLSQCACSLPIPNRPRTTYEVCTLYIFAASQGYPFLSWVQACGVPRQWRPLHVTWNCMLWPQKGVKCIPIEKIFNFGLRWPRWAMWTMGLLFVNDIYGIVNDM
jgi:hypothetical protein